MKKILFTLVFLFALNSAFGQFYRFRANRDFKKLTLNTEITVHSFFINKYPKSNHIPEVKKRLFSIQIQHDFDSVKIVDNLKSFINFMEKYGDIDTAYYVNDLVKTPPTNMLPFVENKIDEYDQWENLQEKYYKYDTATSEYQKFIINFPDSRYIGQVKEIIDFRKQYSYWLNVKESYSVSSYNDYLNLYPNSNYVDEAREKIELCKDWIKVKKENQDSSYSDFAANHKYTVFYDSALYAMKLIEENDWQRAKNKNTYEAYEDFENKYPNGYYYSKAEDSIFRLHNNDWFEQLIYTELFGERDHKQTEITINNYGPIDIYYTFSGKHYKKILVRANSSKTIVLSNGTYRISDKPANPFFHIVNNHKSNKVILVGYQERLIYNYILTKN